MTITVPEIRDLALIGDQKTAAVVSRSGSILWYCPGRFDYPSLLGALLDPQKGGAWEVRLPHAVPGTRRYIEDSAILETSLKTNSGTFTITDWLPAGDGLPRGICRCFSEASGSTAIVFNPAPNYALDPVKLQAKDRGVCINDRYWLHASHPLAVRNNIASCALRLSLV